ncbi:MAG: hypothetical protein GC181_16500 [Bacteroidetes bacterium]|nr:hypothetical protein [Bacteroidota bacterium]
MIFSYRIPPFNDQKYNSNENLTNTQIVQIITEFPVEEYDLENEEDNAFPFILNKGSSQLELDYREGHLHFEYEDDLGRSSFEMCVEQDIVQKFGRQIWDPIQIHGPNETINIEILEKVIQWFEEGTIRDNIEFQDEQFFLPASGSIERYSYDSIDAILALLRVFIYPLFNVLFIYGQVKRHQFGENQMLIWVVTAFISIVWIPRFLVYLKCIRLNKGSVLTFDPSTSQIIFENSKQSVIMKLTEIESALVISEYRSLLTHPEVLVLKATEPSRTIYITDFIAKPSVLMENLEVHKSFNPKCEIKELNWMLPGSF